MLPEMHAINHSSQVEAMGHDGSALFVRFKGYTPKRGGDARPAVTWKYPGAHRSFLERALKGESAGSIVQNEVKPLFGHAAEKVP